MTSRSTRQIVARVFIALPNPSKWIRLKSIICLYYHSCRNTNGYSRNFADILADKHVCYYHDVSAFTSTDVLNAVSACAETELNHRIAWYRTLYDL